MRQILYGEQWIHPEEPQEIQEIFFKYGQKRKLNKGQELLHGGPTGEITLLLKGLCLYRFWDWEDKEHIFSVIVPNRVMGDIDAACNNIANVSAYVVKDSVGIVLPYNIWHREIFGNRDILEIFTKSVVEKQESHIEALLACATMDIDMRLKSFFHALMSAYYTPRPKDWNPVPVNLNTVILGRIVSASRTSVSLTLSEWIKKGLAKRDGRILLLHGNLFEEIYNWWENRKVETSKRNPPPRKRNKFTD